MEQAGLVNRCRWPTLSGYFGVYINRIVFQYFTSYMENGLAGFAWMRQLHFGLYMQVENVDVIVSSVQAKWPGWVYNANVDYSVT